MLKVFYVIILVLFLVCSFIFRDLNQQEVLINYFFSEVVMETSWLVVGSFLSGVLLCSIFVGMEILKVKRKLHIQIRSEKKIKKQLQNLKQDTGSDDDCYGT